MPQQSKMVWVCGSVGAGVEDAGVSTPELPHPHTPPLLRVQLKSDLAYSKATAVPGNSGCRKILCPRLRVDEI